MGAKAQIVGMIPEFWYTASYYTKNSATVVTRIARAYYEEVTNPGCKVAFQAPRARYGRFIDTQDVRRAIGDAVETRHIDG